MCGRDRQTLLLAERKLCLPTSYPRVLRSQEHIVTCGTFWKQQLLLASVCPPLSHRCEESL